ncbi:MAG: ATP synthase F1 subunit delta, partial [Rubrobacter sp.]|nr:ATP synthase F1 subunit delta [Rubrobacter sp.]
RNFLKVLSDNDRTEMLEDVVRNYEALVEEYLGRVEVELVTAVEVSDEALQRIKSRLGQILENREVVLQRRVEPSLIGGAVFNLAGRRIDGSIRGQLRSLHETMLERGVASG